jgi:multidrug resistance efflux pump
LTARPARASTIGATLAREASVEAQNATLANLDANDRLQRAMIAQATAEKQSRVDLTMMTSMRGDG